MSEPYDEDRRDPEVVKPYFEAFKHMTTLNAAAAVVALILRSTPTPNNSAVESLFLVLLGLFAFRISTVVSARGIRTSIRYMQDWRPGAGYDLSRRLATAVGFFVGGSSACWR